MADKEQADRPGALEDWDPAEPWTAADAAAVAAVDALVDRAAAQPPPEEPGHRMPWHPANRPLVQAQLNPRKRQHPDWPEEWYVHVPRTAVTWMAHRVPRGQRMQVRAFPSQAAAVDEAVRVWRDYWGRRDPGHVKATSVPDVQVVRVWSETPEGPAPSGPPDLVLLRRVPPAPAVAPAPAASAEDPLEAWRRRWADRDQRHAAPRATPAAPLTPERWLEAADALQRQGSRLVDPAAWPAVADALTAATAALAAARAGTAPLRADAFRGLLRRVTDAAAGLSGEWPALARRWVADGEALTAQSVDARFRLFVPGSGQGVEWAPSGLPVAVTPDGWIRAGRALVRAGRAARAPGWPAVETAIVAAVRTLRPLDPEAPAPAARDFQRALERLARDAAPLPADLARRVRSWAAEGQALTAAGVDTAYGLFAKDSGQLADAVAALVAGLESPQALGGADLGVLQQLDLAEAYATPLPSGACVLWWARERPLGDTARRETPTVYHTPLDAPPTPKWVAPRLAPSLEAARAWAAERGATLTVFRSTAAVDDWLAQMQATYADRPEQLARELARAFTPRPRPAAPPPEAPADAPRAETATVFLSPWRPGEGVLWTRDAAGHAQPVVRRPDGSWGPPPPKTSGEPVVVRASGGLPAVLTAARAQWPDVRMAEAPPTLASRLAVRLGPPELGLPRDVFWRVTTVPDGPVVAWSYVYRVRTTAQGIRCRLEPVALGQGAGPARFPTAAAAVAALRQAGCAADALAEPLLPAAVATRVLAPALAAERPGPRPADPFATFGALDRPTQEAVLAALPDARLRRAAVWGGYGLTPRDVAGQETWRVDPLARQFRAAERALGDVLAAHPEWRPAVAAPEPDRVPPPARPAAPGLAVTPQ